MKAAYVLHGISWLAILVAVDALFYSLLVTGISTAIAAVFWMAGDLAGGRA